jgi:hypothetical protein
VSPKHRKPVVVLQLEATGAAVVSGWTGRLQQAFFTSTNPYPIEKVVAKGFALPLHS